MKLLIDECLPRGLKHLFREHDCRTVREMGWSGKKNGVLLSLAEADFDVLVTIDQSMDREHDIPRRGIGLLVLIARSNQIEDLEPIVPRALAALRTIRPGVVIRVGE